MRASRIRLIFLLLVAIASLALIACGGDDDNGGTATATQPSGEGTATQPSGGGTATQPSGEKQYGPGVSDTEIKLGGIYPFSGPAAAYGTIGKVVEAYFNMINDQGGVNGRKINFVTRDDQYSPDKTVQAARELVEQEKVLALFNTLGTPTNTAIWDYMNQQKVPQLFVATGASKWGADPEAHPWTIGWQPPYTAEGKIYAQYLLDNEPNAKIGILYQNDDYGQDYIDGIKAGLGDKADSMVVDEQSYATTDASVSTQVSTLKESGADVFYLVATPKFAVQAMVAASQIGWKPLIILNSVSQSIPAVMDPVVQQAGEAAVSNVLTTIYIKDPGDPQWDNDQAVKDYKAFMSEYYSDGNPLDGFNIYGYGVAQTLVQVLKQCGDNLTRENVMAEAANLKDFRVDVLLPGILINTSKTDYYPIQAEQVATYNAADKKWDLVGSIIDVSGT